jgi:MYXO-CTERM domain-containing protein
MLKNPGPPPSPGAEPLGIFGRSWRISMPSVPEALAAAQVWSQRPGVAAASPELWLDRQTASFDDPWYEGQWYLDKLNMEAAWAWSEGDPSIRVAVIDSGIALGHPDLAEAWVGPYDAFADDEDPSPEPGDFCPSGQTTICDDHGTAVAGIIGARARNAEGIVGLCPTCTLVPIRLLGQGRGAMGRDIAAFEHAMAQDVGVINNSWGYTDPIPVPAALAEMIRRASTEPRGGKGALVVFAAGNDDREIRNDELQAMPEVLTVSATDRYGVPTAYTNSGQSVDIAAPSATVTLDGRGGVMTTFGGTSAAAPVVSGLAAWALAMDPELSAAELHDLLVATAVPSPLVTHDADGHHPVYGYGEVSPAGLIAHFVPDESEPEARAGCGCAGSPDGGILLAILAGVAGRWRRRGVTSAVPTR